MCRYAGEMEGADSRARAGAPSAQIKPDEVFPEMLRPHFDSFMSAEIHGAASYGHNEGR